VTVFGALGPVCQCCSASLRDGPSHVRTPNKKSLNGGDFPLFTVFAAFSGNALGDTRRPIAAAGSAIWMIHCREIEPIFLTLWFLRNFLVLGAKETGAPGRESVCS